MKEWSDNNPLREAATDFSYRIWPVVEGMLKMLGVFLAFVVLCGLVYALMLLSYGTKNRPSVKRGTLTTAIDISSSLKCIHV
jgi:Na+/alanine symporter